MTDYYEQFLGTDPGTVVEIVNSDASPYTLKTSDGFEYQISADDFHNYYRKKGEATPAKWSDFVTDENGLIASPTMVQVMNIIKTFEKLFNDYAKARSFLRAAAGETKQFPTNPGLRSALEEKGWDLSSVSEKDLGLVLNADKHIKDLLSGPCAAGAFPERAIAATMSTPLEPKDGSKTTNKVTKVVKGYRGRMKNVEFTVENNILYMKVDLSQEFGPSKSGKTIIVASTEGNVSIPGREEKVGLNVYKTPNSKSGSGRQESFKNVKMEVKDSELILIVDLSLEFGPSKSGKTIIIGSTEGNQLVYGREEKIGLNVYKKLEA